MCKSEVVVGTEIDACRLGASEFECPTVVVSDAVFEDDGVSRYAADWTVPAIFNPSISKIEK